MLKLLAVDVFKAFNYGETCKICGERFVYTSRNSVLKQIWDRDFFVRDFKKHEFECMKRKAKELVEADNNAFDVKLKAEIDRILNET